MKTIVKTVRTTYQLITEDKDYLVDCQITRAGNCEVEVKDDAGAMIGYQMIPGYPATLPTKADAVKIAKEIILRIRA